MGKKGSYLGGSSLMGSSTYFAGWGAKKGKKRLRSVGLIELIMNENPEPAPVLIKRKRRRKSPTDEKT